jgi:hypothetical protein
VKINLETVGPNVRAGSIVGWVSAVGHLSEAGRNDIEDALIAECVIPDKTRSLTVSIERVALPMEIDVARKPGRPKKFTPKRSAARRASFACSARRDRTPSQARDGHTPHERCRGRFAGLRARSRCVGDVMGE